MCSPRRGGADRGAHRRFRRLHLGDRELQRRSVRRAWRDGDEAALEAAVTIRKLFDGKPLVSGVKALLAHIHGDPALARVKPPLAPSRRPTAPPWWPATTRCAASASPDARGIMSALSVAVIGGGIGGLSAALQLAQSGPRRPGLRADPPADHRGRRRAGGEPECLAPADPAGARRRARAHPRRSALGIPSAALAGRPHPGAFAPAGARPRATYGSPRRPFHRGELNAVLTQAMPKERVHLTASLRQL